MRTVGGYMVTPQQLMADARRRGIAERAAAAERALATIRAIMAVRELSDVAAGLRFEGIKTVIPNPRYL